MAVRADINMRTLGRKIAAFAAATHMSGTRALESAAVLLAHNLVEATPPKGSLDKVKKFIRNRVGKTFAYNWQGGSGVLYSKQQGQKGMRWIQASSKHIAGVRPKMILGDQSVGQMTGIERANSGRRKLGNKWIPLGKRGKQHAWELRRFLVSKTSFDIYANSIGLRIGKMKAGWLEVIGLLRGTMAGIPGFVTRQTKRPGEASRQTAEGKLVIMMRNWAPGIRRPRLRKAFRSAVRKTMSDLNKVMREHVANRKNWENLS